MFAYLSRDKCARVFRVITRFVKLCLNLWHVILVTGINTYNFFIVLCVI